MSKRPSPGDEVPHWTRLGLEEPPEWLAGEPPTWSFKNDRVERWVIDEHDAAEEEAERRFALLAWGSARPLPLVHGPQRPHPGVPLGEIFQGMEREAVERASRGDFSGLADLVDPSNPFNHPAAASQSRVRSNLTEGTWKLVANKLAGHWKTRRGRPKATADERRFESPTHGAAGLAQAYKLILRVAYPDQSEENVKAMAAAAAERKTKVPRQKIAGYLKRSKGDRRRLG
jgi:hypothetical protein